MKRLTLLILLALGQRCWAGFDLDASSFVHAADFAKVTDLATRQEVPQSFHFDGFSTGLIDGSGVNSSGGGSSPASTGFRLSSAFSIDYHFTPNAPLIFTAGGQGNTSSDLTTADVAHFDWGSESLL